MPKFIVEVARDATVKYRATVEAESLDEVKSHMKNHGYNGPIEGEWEEYAVNSFDDVEEYIVYSPADYEILHEEQR